MIPPATVVPTTPVPTTAPPTPSTPPPVPRPAPIKDTDHQLVFADDFDAAASGSIWVTAPFGNSLPATVTDGVLSLKTTAANSHHWGYIASTGPRSESEPNYPQAKAWQRGYFEARVRYTNSPWSWPAFWLFSMAKTEVWPGEDCSKLNAEWDIMENGVENGEGRRPAGNWYFTSLHRNTRDGTDDGYCGQPDEERRHGQHMPNTNLADWHTWGALWAEDRMCTYLDGSPIHCTEPWDSTAQPMHLVFTMQYLSQCGACPPRPHELELQVDWVRVWQTR